jgi:hypothetical protein
MYVHDVIGSAMLFPRVSPWWRVVFSRLLGPGASLDHRFICTKSCLQLQYRRRVRAYYFACSDISL